MTLVVGFPPGKDDWSSIELGATLAKSAGTDLLVVTVVPSVWPTPVAGHTDREFEDWAEQQGAAAVAEANAILAEHCPDIAAVARWTPGRSVASTLLEQAEEVDARMVVVGSGSTGSYGRVHPGAIGDWLLHFSHIPVAVATHGYAASERGRVRRVSCAFRGDERSLQTVERTAAICADIGASLRLVTFAVRGRTVYTAGVGVGAEDMVLDRWISQATAAQADALKTLEESGNAPDRGRQRGGHRTVLGCRHRPTGLGPRRGPGGRVLHGRCHRAHLPELERFEDRSALACAGGRRPVI